MKATSRRCRTGNIVAIEVVMRALVFDDDGARRAPACAGHHLLAVFCRRPIVERADQDQGRNARAPGGVAEPAAARIEYRGGAEIRPIVARRKIWTHRPQNRNCRHWPSRAARSGPCGRNPAAAASRAPRARRRCVRDPGAGAWRWRGIGDQDRANRSCRETAPHSLRPRAACPNPRFPVRSPPRFFFRPSQPCIATIAGNGPVARRPEQQGLERLVVAWDFEKFRRPCPAAERHRASRGKGQIA